jgi:nitrate/TMAO reductase-like tetraheme cytochrome c subunit
MIIFLGKNKGIKIAGLVVLALALTFGLTITALEQPVTCSVCHDEKIVYDSWRKTPMAEEGVKCLDCHADSGVIGHLKAHLRGATYLFKTAKTYKVVIPKARCLRCHGGDGGSDSENRISADHFIKAMQTGQTCASCHRLALHIRIIK